jgi:hypothetical protein
MSNTTKRLIIILSAILLASVGAWIVSFSAEVQSAEVLDTTVSLAWVTDGGPSCVSGQAPIAVTAHGYRDVSELTCATVSEPGTANDGVSAAIASVIRKAGRP